MAPPHSCNDSSKSGGFGNFSSPNQTSQAPSSGFGSAFMVSPSEPAFGTSNAASGFNGNQTFGFPSTEPASGSWSTSSSPAPLFSFPSTGPGFTNITSPFGGPFGGANTPSFGSNWGASKPQPFGTGFNSDPPSSPFLGSFGQKPTANMGTSQPSLFGTGFNTDPTSSAFLGPLGQKSTGNFSFSSFPNTNNSGGTPDPFRGSFVASPSMPAFVTSTTAVDFNQNTTTGPAFGLSSTSSSPPLFSAPPTFGFPTSTTAVGFNPNTTTGSAFGLSSTSSSPPLFSAPPTFGCPTSTTAVGFNQNTTTGPAFGLSSTSSAPPLFSTPPAFGFPTTTAAGGFNQNTNPRPAFGLSSTSSSLPLFSTPPAFGFPTTDTRFVIRSEPNVSITPLWGSNSGASRSSLFDPTAFTSKPASSTSHDPFGQQTTAKLSFLDTNNSETGTPLFGSKSGQPPFSSQNGGSRTTPYSASKAVDNDCAKVISICAMPFYSVKSHEELRLEDYQQSTKANPISTSPPINNEVHPPLASQNKGTGVAPYTLTKPVGEEGSTQLISISAMPVYEVKSHEELRWEDYQLKDEGGDGVAGALNGKPNLFTPPTSTQTSGSPSPFLFKIPTDAASFYPYPNVATKTFEQPSPFSIKMPTWQPIANTIGVPCAACGSFGKETFSLMQVQKTPEPCQTNPADPTVAKPPTMAEDNIVPVKDPFGVQSSKSQLFADHATPATSIQIGISSMPVVDKPAPSRISSVLTLRLFPQRQSPAHLKKGQPKSHVKKVPFFDKAYPYDIPRPINHPMRRENPKSAFMMSIPEPIHNDTVEEELHVATNLDLMPKLTRSDYYTEPLISELETNESLDPGFCGRVRGFVIGRHGYGKIEFEGETDIRGLDLDSLVEFNTKEVVVYKDESKKAGVGKGLNKPALVTLMNVKCIDKKTGEVFVDGDRVAKYERVLKKMAHKQGAEFVSYDPAKGEWKFHVHHF